MRYLILSDIHANLSALEAVLTDATGLYDLVLNCGDMVGYGPHPNEVIQFCRDNCVAVIRGNHDKAVAGLADLEWFNPVARHSVEWTAAQLSREHADWLAALPQGPLEHNGFTLVHGSPDDEDEYIIDVFDIAQAAASFTAPLTFFGHTHLQGAFELHRNGIRQFRHPDFVAESDSVFAVNPGSVGQPRDRDPRAGYALYDSESRVVELRRVEYDLDRTHTAIMRAGLPELLGLRLYQGV